MELCRGTLPTFRCCSHQESLQTILGGDEHLAAWDYYCCFVKASAVWRTKSRTLYITLSSYDAVLAGHFSGVVRRRTFFRAALVELGFGSWSWSWGGRSARARPGRSCTVLIETLFITFYHNLIFPLAWHLIIIIIMNISPRRARVLRTRSGRTACTAWRAYANTSVRRTITSGSSAFRLHATAGGW